MTKILLTGANGFIAAVVLRKALSRGHTVIGTVRSLSKTHYYAGLPDDNVAKKAIAEGRLTFAVVEDITAPGAFDEVLKGSGAEVVLHTSSPFTFDVKDIDQELLQPAIRGTVGILDSVHRVAPSVKRVIVLSSFASIIDRSKGNWPGKVYAEADWNPVTREEALKDSVSGYYASKAFAERAAWDFVDKEKPKFELTTLCPPMVYGPPEQELPSLKKLNQSNLDIYTVFNGTSDPSFGVWLWVDVRDLAEALVRAVDAPNAGNQRYLISGGNYSPQMIAEYVWKNYPERAAAKGVKKYPDGSNPYPDEGYYGVDTSKSVKDLGLTYRSFETMMKETLADFERLEKEGK